MEARQACALHEPEGLLAAARFPRFYPAPTAIPRAQPAAQYVCVALGGIRPSANLQLLPQNLSHVPSNVALLYMTILSYIYFR